MLGLSSIPLSARRRFMKKIIFINLIIIYSQQLSAQDEDDLIDDSRNQYQQCLELNTIDLFEDYEKLSSRIASGHEGLKGSYWITIGAGYKKVVKEIMASSIDKAYSKLPLVKAQVDEEWRISSHLENLFYFHFDQGYVEAFDLKLCRVVEGEKDYTDYWMILKPTVELIKKHEQRVQNNCLESNDCPNDLVYDYLFKIAVLMFKPELSEYVAHDVLQEKKMMRFNNQETEEDLDKIWYIIES